MSHNPEQTIICPNCGYTATYNYCAQCGQETHLHKDTFRGLFAHFIAHYFHYDSKFWKTIKALLFSPGKLTIAYKNKQRMRYIAPVSLYIFISFVFFLLFSFVMHAEDSSTSAASQTVTQQNDSTAIKMANFLRLNNESIQKNRKAQNRNTPSINNVDDEIIHFLPKVAFFMIPVMALLIQILFFKRKEFTYVDHIIFSLHYQSFFFLLFFVEFISPAAYLDNKVCNVIDTIIVLALFMATIIYMVRSLMNVYNIRLLRASIYAAVVNISYLFALIVVGVFLFAVWSYLGHIFQKL